MGVTPHAARFFQSEDTICPAAFVLHGGTRMKAANRLATGAAALLLATTGQTLLHAQEAAAAALPVDVGDFGSDQPVERPNMPSRGIISFGPKDFVYQTGPHWEQWDWKFTAKRWGTYNVRLTYTLKHATLPVQLKIGKPGEETRLKETLTGSVTPKKTYLGKIHLAEAGESPFSMYAPPSGANAGFVLMELAFIPAPEGGTISQSEDGSITLHAKDATTWSENMRYEPKPEKNCLGYWTSPDDYAEWEFDVKKPGKYKVAVVHGCGGGNHGSQVAVKSGDQTVKFTVQDTGGFQKWQEVQIGEIEIRAAGMNRLTIDPESKVKSAVLDVQKIVLTPVS